MMTGQFAWHSSRRTPQLIWQGSSHTVKRYRPVQEGRFVVVLLVRRRHFAVTTVCFLHLTELLVVAFFLVTAFLVTILFLVVLTGQGLGMVTIAGHSLGCRQAHQRHHTHHKQNFCFPRHELPHFTLLWEEPQQKFQSRPWQPPSHKQAHHHCVPFGRQNTTPRHWLKMPNT